MIGESEYYNTLAEDLHERELLAVNDHAARLDAGHVKDVVDDAESVESSESSEDGFFDLGALEAPIEEPEQEPEEEQEEEKSVEETVAEVTLHFSSDKAVSPMKGQVILPYSMDKTIYFPTLDQYKCNPAIIIKGDVDSKVVFIAKGSITNIENNEETGCTVTQNLGDGYSAVYGQLKDITVKVGDTVEGNEILGYINTPTKYYSLEGSNLYFKLLKDGKPVDPTTYVNR